MTFYTRCRQNIYLKFPDLSWHLKCKKQLHHKYIRENNTRAMKTKKDNVLFLWYLLLLSETSPIMWDGESGIYEIVTHEFMRWQTINLWDGKLWIYEMVNHEFMRWWTMNSLDGEPSMYEMVNHQFMRCWTMKLWDDKPWFYEMVSQELQF